jgi:hypothetical protein
VNLKDQIINTFSLSESDNCLEDIGLQTFEVIDDQQNLPCRLLIDGKSGQFIIENPSKHLLHFLKIDNCVLFTQDGPKCDFAVFNEDELIFVELKKIEQDTVSTHKKRKAKRTDAYVQLENTLKIFKSKNIDLSRYQKNNKLYVIASVLDYNPPVTRMPAAKTKNQQKNLEFEMKYSAILLTGHSYEFT